MGDEYPFCSRMAQLFHRVQRHLIPYKIAWHVNLAGGHTHSLTRKDHIMVYHVGQGTFRVSRCLEYRDLMITEIQDISLFYDLVYHKIFIPVVRGFCKSGPRAAASESSRIVFFADGFSRIFFA